VEVSACVESPLESRAAEGLGGTPASREGFARNAQTEAALAFPAPAPAPCPLPLTPETACCCCCALRVLRVWVQGGLGAVGEGEREGGAGWKGEGKG